jgi:diguanylate cyclase (GGDEF)-like protein
MRISSMPIKDTDGKWCGCRGAGHDITEETAQKAHLAKLAAQELVFARIIDGIRQEINPEPLFAIAGRGACEALNSTRIWVGRRCCNNRLEAGYKSRVPKEAEDLLMSWFSIEKDRLDRGYQLTDLSCDDWRLFISPIVSGNSVDGVIMLVRSVRAPDLDQMEKRLLKVLSNHLGVALVQIRAREKLERLSRTDELTGLMNRRAFHEDVSRRLEHGKRTKVPGALLYIDLDDFKPVNDRFGHETGDAVLKGVGELLIRHTRVGDLVARLGGDEFAVWLENIPLSRAIEKAGELQVMCENLSAGLGIENPGLGFSIGVAPVCGAGEESLERLLAAADGAMYRAKQQGKGSCAVAEEAGAGRERK